jgi:hypothetical protein
MAQAGVRIEVIYSDHANHLILIVDDVQAGETVVADWNSNQIADAKQGGS